MEINQGVNNANENNGAGGPGAGDLGNENGGQSGTDGNDGGEGDGGKGDGKENDNGENAGAGQTSTANLGKAEPKSKGGKGGRNKPDQQRVIDNANAIGSTTKPRPTMSSEQVASSLEGRDYVNLRNLETGVTQENIPATTAANLIKHSPEKFELVD